MIWDLVGAILIASGIALIGAAIASRVEDEDNSNGLLFAPQREP